MRTFRIIGIAGTVAALLLSASTVFAEGPSTGAVGEKQSASTTTIRAEESQSPQDALQVVRQEMEARVAKDRTKAEARLTEIKDKAKQQMAQGLAKQFDNLNKTWTDNFSQTLDRFDALLQKIQDRAAIAATGGKDIATVTAALQAARTAVSNARTAVIAQTAKAYSLTLAALPTTATATTIGQEKLTQALRTTFQNLHTTLFQDLFALRDGPMTDARKAVQNALQTLGQTLGDGEGNATSTRSNQ